MRRRLESDRFTAATGRARASGLTLLELLVVLALAAIVAAAAVPGVAAVLRDLELRGAAIRLAGAMVRARTAALRDGRAWAVTAGTRSFAVGPAGAPGTSEELPGGVAIRAAGSGGEVRFSAAGFAENATFRLALGGRERAVVVNQRGRVSLE